MNLFKYTSLGIQHVLAMYAGAVVVPLIVGGALGLSGSDLTYLVSIDIFMCGIATILQVWKNRFFGIGLPVVLGCTFTAVGPMIAIGGQYGITAIYGAILAAGIFVILISPVFSKLIAFFPPVVTGSVVTVIGITLIPVAMGNMAGGEGARDYGSLQNISLALGTLLFIIVLTRLSNGFVRSIAILIGLVVGTIVASFMGLVDLAPVKDASWFHLIEPLHFGVPTFELTAILTMILVVLVSLVESTGVYFALSDICEQEISEEDVKKGYRAEGVAIVLGALFNAFPYTTYSQNVGLIQLSGIKKKQVIYLVGGMLVVLGLVPKIGAVTTIIPAPVLGAAMLVMFGMVMAYGIKMLTRVDFNSQENLFIIACSIGIGLGVTAAPSVFEQLPASIQILTDNGIVAGSVMAILLNLVFHASSLRKPEKESLIESKAS
ncbi:nucleobase:cation symporter-2 family protein [Pseudalkalibacillus hwajinpoensis]|uniref:nucleobase:cation symporter-2 family protein n=1 Tax=Guptibacillus hwajinpoensis TaxID=208199 RepID=UPI001CD1CDE1|nr:nucleobase:cation symporter-2 family protein [Pseudalkalibacillus hwajinpoensis]MCA0990572.1 purine permease [Pseudalkalibacillus hwajinpoensis]